MAWRLSKSLEKLRTQVNAAAPGRSKSSDGTKGDDAHAARKSDHNPDSKGVVRALDITHDPKGGVDSEKLAEALRLSRDPRISYIISNRKIASSTAVHGEAAWAWRLYSGANAHNHHCHISVVADDAKADDVREWDISGAFGAAKPGPVVVVKPTLSTDRRTRMGATILGYEARRDKQGRLAVYALPANDGGGTYEVAGINDRYHPAQAAQLRALIQAGRYDEAEASAAEYLVKYTDAAAGWSTNAGVEFYLRDCVFNRGPTGAAKILQMALGAKVDGVVGTETRDALAKIEPGALLNNLRAARERYEDAVAGPRPNLRAGLVNRWNKALVDAKKFAAETPTTTQRNVAAGGALAGGAVVTAGAKEAVDAGLGLFGWSMIALGVVAVIAIGWLVYRYGWPAFKAWRARPASYHDELLTAQQSTADKALPPAGDIWAKGRSIEKKADKVDRNRRLQKKGKAASKKAAGKKKPAKKSTKRKAA